MRLRPLHQQRSALFARERPPRLVLRFAVVLSLALAIASALILLVVRLHATAEAERAAIRHAELIASTLVQRELTPSDVSGRVTTGRRRELDALFRRHVLGSGTVAVSIVRADGLVTYSTDRAAVGSRVAGTLAADAAGGSIVSTVPATGAGATRQTKTLETYAPVGSGALRGAVVIIQGYGPIEAAARATQLRVGGVLEGLLIVLFLVFLPLLARLTRQIKRQIDRIHAQAFYDELTGLPNRAQLLELLQLAMHRAADGDRQLAVLLIDLDRFREINDTLGHDTGDALLVETADRLRAVVEDEWLLARLGGDQFAIVIEHEEERDATFAADNIRAALEPSTVVDGLELSVDSTIGIAHFPEHGRDTATLLKHAEVATYAAKERRLGVLAYDPAVDPHDPDQLSLVAELRSAAESGQLQLHYQPKVDLATGALVGCEALAYWQHPSRGLLPPGAFIPVAERTGSIRFLSRAVLANAVEQLREWTPLQPGLTIAVNLSAVDLLDLELPDQLDALLRRAGVDPRRLCIELTESTVMADPERAKSVLDRIVSKGVRVSIDDFGTGHSSLAYLKHLPVSELKIDRSFIAGMGQSSRDRLLVEAVIQLGHNFGLAIVAEGVETSETHDALRGLGCDQAQGYLYGRPQAAEAVTARLASSDLEAA